MLRRTGEAQWWRIRRVGVCGLGIERKEGIGRWDSKGAGTERGDWKGAGIEDWKGAGLKPGT